MTFPKPFRVLCVDDNEMVASALERRIESEVEMKWVGVVLDGALAFDRVLEVRPDIVLLDIDMPGLNAFSVVERLVTAAPDVRVVMFSGHVNSAYIERALDSGAWGYLSKNDSVARVIEGIYQAARGEIALSSEVQSLQRRPSRSPSFPPASPPATSQ